MNFKSLSSPHWLDHSRISTLARLPWNQADGLRATPVADIMSFAVPNVAEVKKWPLVEAKALPGDKVALSSNTELLVLDAAGAISHRFALDQPGGFKDLLPTPAGWLCYRAWPGGKSSLSLLREDGTVAWDQTDLALEHLLQLGQSYYGVQLTGDAVSILPIDLKNGSLGAAVPTASQTTPLMAGREGEICFMSFDPANNQRVWNRQVLGQASVATPIPSDLYGVFVFPQAADAQSNGYAIMSYEAGKFDPQGNGNWKVAIESLVPAADGSIWSAHSDSTGIHLFHKEGDKVETADLKVPEDLQQKWNHPKWQLIRAEASKFYFSGRDPRSYQTHFIACDLSENSIKEVEQPDLLAGFATILQGSQTWSFTNTGDLIVPVATPEALVLLKIEVQAS